jgi:MFS family permease
VTRRALIALGIGQCINWGPLYYAFAVLVVPVQRELGVEMWWVTGAFSLALLMSGALAPAVGRWGDRNHGPLVMQIGGITAAVLLAVWTLLPGVVVVSRVGWAGLVHGSDLLRTSIRHRRSDLRRSRRTLAGTRGDHYFGGLASTVFLPATAFLVRAIGWRRAVVGLAFALAASTLCTRQVVFRTLAPLPATKRTSSTRLDVSPATGRFRFVIVAGVFTLATVASGAFSTILLALSLALHAGGLGLVALGASTPIVAAGTMILALGNGLTTLVRPHVVQTMFGIQDAGTLNGRIARRQQLARAGGPVFVAWLVSTFTYAGGLALFALTFVVSAMIALGTLRKDRRQAAEHQAA